MRKIYASILSVLLIFLLVACENKTNTYIVNFIIDDNTNTAVIVEGGKIIPESSYPHISTFELENWYLDQNFTAIFDKEFKINSNLTLYAKAKLYLKNINLSNQNILTYESNHNLFKIYLDNTLIITTAHKEVDITSYITKDTFIIKVDLVNKADMKLLSLSKEFNVLLAPKELIDFTLDNNLIININSTFDTHYIIIDGITKGYTTNNIYDLSNDVINEDMTIIIRSENENNKEGQIKKTIKYYESLYNEDVNIDFSNITKESFTNSSINYLNKFDIIMNNAISGRTVDDKINNKYSARLKKGHIEILKDINKSKIVSFDTKSYDTVLKADVSVWVVSTHDTFMIDSFTTTTDITHHTYDLSKYYLNEEYVYYLKIVNSNDNDFNINNIIYSSTYKSNYVLTKFEEKENEEIIEYSEYYSSVHGLYGAELFYELRNIISNMTKVSYGDARYILENSDLDPNDNFASVRGIYDQKKIATYWIGEGAGAWQREHVWPNSKLGIDRVNNNSKNQGSDLHNLRAIHGPTNSSRSNRYFVDGTNSHKTVGSDGYYPSDYDKGDVARILLYMVVRYEFLNLTSSHTHLTRSGYVMSSAFAGSLDVLLKFHEEDPVDNFEVRRNDFIYDGVVEGRRITPQGNRNPFIDYPNLFKHVHHYLTLKDQAQFLRAYHLADNLCIIDDKRYLYEI